MGVPSTKEGVNEINPVTQSKGQRLYNGLPILDQVFCYLPDLISYYIPVVYSNPPLCPPYRALQACFQPRAFAQAIPIP